MNSVIIAKKEKQLAELRSQTHELVALEELVYIEAESYAGLLHKLDPKAIKPAVSKLFGLYIQLGGLSRAMLTNIALEAVKACGDDPQYAEEFGSYESDIKPVHEIIDEIIEELRKKQGFDLSFEDFKTELMAKIQEAFPEYKVVDLEIVKANDIVLHGLCVQQNNVGPTFYIDDMYKEAKENSRHKETLISQMAKYISEACKEAFANMPLDVSVIAETTKKMEWDSVKDTLGFRLVDMSLNKKFLEDKIYRETSCGLAIVPEMIFTGSEDMGWGCSAIPKEALKDLSVSSEEVINQAMKNMPNISPMRLESIESKIHGGGNENYLESGNAPGRGLFVLTTDNAYHGSAAIFTEGMKERLYNMFGAYYIIPSSIHELLIMRCENAKKEELMETIRSANRCVVDPEEILSDNLYMYDGHDVVVCK